MSSSAFSDDTEADETGRVSGAVGAVVPDALPRAPDREVTLQVRDIHGHGVAVTVPPAAVVRELRAAAVAAFEAAGTTFTAEEVDLVQSGTRLADDKTVEEAGLKHDSVIFIIRRSALPSLAPSPPRRAPTAAAAAAAAATAPSADLGVSYAGDRFRTRPLAAEAVAGSATAAAEVPAWAFGEDDTTDRAWCTPRFDAARTSTRLRISRSGGTAETWETWGTVALVGPGLRAGRRSWAFRIDSAGTRCGCAVGVAATSDFEFHRHNLGAQGFSFAYSKTGKFGRPGCPFAAFGGHYRTGDVVEVDLDATNGILRFWRNDMLQGSHMLTTDGSDSVMAAYVSRDLVGKPFVPAVCLGSQEGGRTTRVKTAPASMRGWDPARTHHRISLSEEGRQASNDGKWATTLGAHPGFTSGIFAFSVQLTRVKSGGGVAIGVVDADRFDHRTANLGASEHSWAYSKTGKRGCGRGFHAYGPAFSSGDTITCICDVTRGTLRYVLNGADLGLAYDPDIARADAAASNGTLPAAGPESADLRFRRLVPAVCIGSSAGRIPCDVALLPAVRYPLRFNPHVSRPTVVCNGDGRTAETAEEWTSLYLDVEGTRRNWLTFAIEIVVADGKSGVAVGVADKVLFDPRRHNLGASPYSWAYSKTGKKGDGSGFEHFGPRFRTGDIITCDLDLHKEQLSFLRNGEEVGVAFSSGLVGRHLVPAVCIGCNAEHSSYSCVRVVPPPPLRFDRARSSRSILLRAGAQRTDAVAVSSLLREDEGPATKWYTAMADHPGVQAGQYMSFGVRVESCMGGLAVGVVDPRHFRTALQNMGAAPNSWALSRSGKRSDGTGEGPWRAYSDRFRVDPGAIFGVVVDLRETPEPPRAGESPSRPGTVSFFLNGRYLGVAFDGLLSIPGLTLTPAVCIGASTTRTSAVELVPWVPTARSSVDPRAAPTAPEQRPGAPDAVSTATFTGTTPRPATSATPAPSGSASS